MSVASPPVTGLALVELLRSMADDEFVMKP